MTLRVSETGLAAGPGEMTLTIVDRDELAEGVCRLTLGANGNQLPAWEPGAHIEVQLPSGLVRHYSLCGSPGDLARYQIAVLEGPAGRGGSRELHATARVGTSLVVRNGGIDLNGGRFVLSVPCRWHWHHADLADDLGR